MKEVIKITLVLGFLVFNSSMSYSQTKEMLQDKFVIVLDIQEEFTENHMTENSAQELINSVNYVIENTDPKKVIYVSDTTVHKVLSISFKKGFTIDTTLSKYDLDNRLKLVNENMFCKTGANAFESVELTNFLEENNAKEIIVIGLMAEECTSKTLLGGKELGYDMYVIPEAIVGKSQKSKNKAVKKLEKKGIKILHF